MPTSPMARIDADLASGGTVVIDGATGTELERRGAAMHHAAWCAMATLTAPDILLGVHRDYIRAGARVITTNTFSTNRNMLEPAGLGSKFEELTRRAVEIAREARSREGADERVAVAGSMSHQTPLIAGTDERDTHAVPDVRRAQRNFAEMAEALACGGVDLILMEMMSDPDLANAAIAAARATGLPVWVGFSVRAGESGAPLAFTRPELDAAALFDAVKLDGVKVAGVMHSGVDLVPVAIEILRQRWEGPLMAYPDSGYAKMPHWQFVDVIAPAELCAHAHRWTAAGVQVIGGCCGLGVEHVAALAGVT